MARKVSKSDFHSIRNMALNKISRKKKMKDNDTFFPSFDEFFTRVGGTDPYFYYRDPFVGMDISLFAEYVTHLFEDEIEKKSANPWGQQVKEIGEKHKEEIINNMKRKYKRLYDFFVNLENPVPIYRSIIARSPDKINVKRLGHHWSWNKEHAIYYFGEKTYSWDKDYIVTAIVKKEDINWIETFLRNMHPREDPFTSKEWYMEREIYLDNQTPVTIYKIEEKDEEGVYKEIPEYIFSKGKEGKAN